MADRFWRGGTAAWDGTAGTKWAATAGGATGASVPTTADDVYFDATSSGTCTISAGNTGAKSINCTGFTGGITGSADITVAGNVTLVSGMTYTHNGRVTFTGTATLITAGKTFSGIGINGSGITLTLGDSLTFTAFTSITVTEGTFDTAGYNVTGRAIVSRVTNTRTINLNNSTVTLTTPQAFDLIGGVDNLTFNAGTSLIRVTSTSANIVVTSVVSPQIGITFYDVEYSSTSNNTFRDLATPNCTFRNLTFSAPTGPGNAFARIDMSGGITVTGTLTCSSANIFARPFLRGDAEVITTLTVNTLAANNCDFRAITIAGAAAGTAPTGAGDRGNNSGIVFPTPKTVYRVGSQNTWSGVSSWATVSGGAGSDSNYPLAQDTAVIDDNATPSTAIGPGTGYEVGTVDFSARTTAITYNESTTYYGSLILSSAVTPGSSSGSVTFRTYTGTSSLVTAGKTIYGLTILATQGFSVLLGDALTVTDQIQFSSGNFDSNGYNITLNNGAMIDNGTGSSTINFRSSTITLNALSTTFPFLCYSTSSVFLPGSYNIIIALNTSSTINFTGVGNLNKITAGKSGDTWASIFRITGPFSIAELASLKAVAHTIQFASNMGTISKWSVTGTSGNVVTVNSSVSGTSRTLNMSQITTGVDYLSVTDINIPQPNRFYVGANSTDGGNNTNVIFTAAPAAPPTGSSFFVLI